MHTIRSLTLGSISALLCLFLALPAFATPSKLSQQGRLVDSDGEPLAGAHQITFRIYDEASEGSLLWSESRNLDLDDGYYATTLGDQTPLDDDIFAGSAWLELTVDGAVLEPRHQVVSVPSALRSVVAEHVDGGVVDAAEIWVGGQQVIDDTGAWVGAGGANSWDDLSDIPTDLADGDSDTLGSMSCATGQVARWDSVAGQWVCATDTDTLGNMSCATGQLAIYDSLSGQWVCGSDTDTLGSMGCFDGGIPAWSSALSQWICAADQDTDADTLAGLNCANGGVPVWDALLTQWTCALSSDTVLTEGEVEAYVINGAIDLNAATTMGGQALATADQLTGIAFGTLSGVPTDLADGDDILTEAQVETFITNAPIDLPTGTTINGEIIGAGANLGSNVTVGSVVPGENYLTDHTAAPVPIPDDPTSAANSPRFVAGGATSINNFSVDIDIAHPEMGDLRITLYHDDGTAVLLYDGELPGTVNMVGNIARDFSISGGTIYALYGKDANGTWRLEVVDTTSGNTGTLRSWALNINETWSGDLFVGNSITSDGDITTTGNIEVIQGSDLIFKNTAGAETLRINGETGQITGASGNCPTGMVQKADFCIEASERGHSNWYSANNECFNAGRRLCTGAEWMTACRNNSGMNQMTGNWEWVADVDGGYWEEHSVRMHDCGNSSIASWGSGEYFRCCKSL